MIESVLGDHCPTYQRWSSATQTGHIIAIFTGHWQPQHTDLQLVVYNKFHIAQQLRKKDISTTLIMAVFVARISFDLLGFHAECGWPHVMMTLCLIQTISAVFSQLFEELVKIKLISCRIISLELNNAFLVIRCFETVFLACVVDMFNGTVTPQTVSEVSTTGSTRGDGDHLPVKVGSCWGLGQVPGWRAFVKYCDLHKCK